MRSLWLGLWAASLVLLPAAPPLAADDSGSEAVVARLMTAVWSARIEPAPAARQARLERAIEAATDLPLVSRLVLGRYWRRLDQDRQAAFQTLFRTVVIGSLARRLDDYVKDLEGELESHFRLRGSHPVGDHDVIVQSRVRPAIGPSLAVDWRLRNGAIIDLAVEGVSLLISQRAEFTAVIERRSIDGLLAELRERAASAGG